MRTKKSQRRTNEVPGVGQLLELHWRCLASTVVNLQVMNEQIVVIT